MTVVPDEAGPSRAAIIAEPRPGLYPDLRRHRAFAARHHARDLRPACDRDIPGISEWLRRESARETPHAVFSRAYSGMKGNTIIVNFPGSLRGAEFCAGLLAGVMAHGRDMVHGGDHPSHEKT